MRRKTYKIKCEKREYYQYNKSKKCANIQRGEKKNESPKKKCEKPWGCNTHTHTHTFILGDNINVVKNSYDKVEQNRIKKHRKTVYICDTKIDCLW